jgi:hypothetical protein
MGTLAFGYVLPTTGRTLDFHQLGTCAAGRTRKKESRNHCHNRFRGFFF